MNEIKGWVTERKKKSAVEREMEDSLWGWGEVGTYSGEGKGRETAKEKA